jgi:hypothetical protein
MASEKTPSIQELALAILQDEDFFGKVREAVRRGGLVGEVRNALAIYVIAMSSLLERPLNAIIKGPSSAGKNFLALRVLRLFPKTAIREITSSSETAWNYSGDDFRHRIVYLQERNDASGAVHPVRLLISENKLTRIVSVREGGQWVKKEFVAEGPISAISTSTRDRIEADDETRHVSLWVDAPEDQTRRIVRRYVSPSVPLSDNDIEVWHEVYTLASRRISVPIEFPDWFEKIADNVFVGDLRVRRYFPAFLEAVGTIALIRSFREHPDDYESGESIPVAPADYGIATYIFEDVFVESLSRGEDESLETAKTIETIAASQNDELVDADQLAKLLNISYDKASAKLRSASEAGVIVQSNKPEKNNNKRYRAAKPPRFVPDPKEVAGFLRLKKPIEFIHPLTGKKLKFPGK